MIRRKDEAIKLLDSIIYFARKNAEAEKGMDGYTWAEHARKCDEVRSVLFAALGEEVSK